MRLAFDSCHVIASLVCAAIAKRMVKRARRILFCICCWLPRTLNMTVPVSGFVRGFRRIRSDQPLIQSPRSSMRSQHNYALVANGGGLLQQGSVGGDFLHLVRLGIRAGERSLVRYSIESGIACSSNLRRSLWRRYNNDAMGEGYRQRLDGKGVGRSCRF